MGNLAVLAKRKVDVWLSLNLAMRRVQDGLKHLLQFYWVSQRPWQVLVYFLGLVNDLSILLHPRVVWLS
jgi:hypothetical protein